MTDDSGNLQSERTDYGYDVLTREALDSDPMQVFANWMQAARDKKIIDATSMALATCTSDGKPSVRMVLLKQFGPEGFCWFTSYHSRKGQELTSNPVASLMLFWREMERQVRIEGTVTKMTAAESDAYFGSRPISSQFSAAASPQSQVIENQNWMMQQVTDLRERTGDKTLTRPASWGGYRLSPLSIEFWQGRPSRLHDRFNYRKQDDGSWHLDRLAP